MIISGGEGNFESCPEYIGKGVCVDVTPLKERQSEYGMRNEFRIVFEVDQLKSDGKRFCVWSRGLTPTFNEKSNLRKMLKMWFGRDLTKEEMASFDTETLIGRGAQLNVINEESDGKTYANIVACTPDRSGDPLTPSGTFIRAKDREANGGGAPRGGTASAGGGGGGYRRAQQPTPPSGEAPLPFGTNPGPVDHAAVKVHVGKFKGHELRDLAPEHVQALVDKWLPVGKLLTKPLADDRRLIAALDWWVEMEAKAKAMAEAAANAAKEKAADDEIPMGDY